MNDCLTLPLFRPILSVPARVFSSAYFAFWVLVSIAWGFGAAIIITVLPLSESAEDINTVLSGLFNAVTGRNAVRAEDPNAKEVDDDDTPEKGEEEVVDAEAEADA